MSVRKTFRALMANPGYVLAPGAHDALTARLVQIAGFDAVYLTGGGYSRANGYPGHGSADDDRGRSMDLARR